MDLLFIFVALMFAAHSLARRHSNADAEYVGLINELKLRSQQVPRDAQSAALGGVQGLARLKAHGTEMPRMAWRVVLPSLLFIFVALMFAAHSLARRHSNADAEYVGLINDLKLRSQQVPRDAPDANLRGALLPVVNLHGFLRGQPATLNRDSRILVIEKDEILSGLAVEEVFGVKHFLEEQRLPDAAASENWLSPYVVGSFRVASESWEVFDVHTLIAAPAFMQVAA